LLAIALLAAHEVGNTENQVSPGTGETFIALNAQPISGAVRRGGTQLGRYSSTSIPPLRTAPDVDGVPVYKHL